MGRKAQGRKHRRGAGETENRRRRARTGVCGDALKLLNCRPKRAQEGWKKEEETASPSCSLFTKLNKPADESDHVGLDIIVPFVR